MTIFTLSHKNRNIQGVLCTAFFRRFRGLMFRKSININDGILIDQGSSTRLNSAIHMFFMNFDIAVIWLDSEFKIVDKTFAKKWHPFYQPILPARYVFETHPDNLDIFETGEILDIRYEN